MNHPPGSKPLSIMTMLTVLACSSGDRPVDGSLEATEILAAVGSEPVVRDILAKLEARGCRLELQPFEFEDPHDDVLVLRAATVCSGSGPMMTSSLVAVFQRSLEVLFVTGVSVVYAESADENDSVALHALDFAGFSMVADGTVVEEDLSAWLDRIGAGSPATRIRAVSPSTGGDPSVPSCRDCQAAVLTGIANATDSNECIAAALGGVSVTGGPTCLLGAPACPPLLLGWGLIGGFCLVADEATDLLALVVSQFLHVVQLGCADAGSCPSEPLCWGDVPDCRPLIGNWGPQPYCALDPEGVFACCADRDGLNGVDCSSDY